MKRLTYVDKQSRKIYLYSSSADVIGKLAEYEDLEEQCIKENAIGIKLLIEKWKEFLEDMHELLEYRKLKAKGRLLILPCAVGDTAYYLHRTYLKNADKWINEIDEVEVDSFILNINLFVNVSYYIGSEVFRKTLTPYKTLFFTREEAETALEKMKGEEHE